MDIHNNQKFQEFNTNNYFNYKFAISYFKLVYKDHHVEKIKITYRIYIDYILYIKFDQQNLLLVPAQIPSQCDRARKRMKAVAKIRHSHCHHVSDHWIKIERCRFQAVFYFVVSVNEGFWRLQGIQIH